MSEIMNVFSGITEVTDIIVYAAIAIVTLIGILKCLLPLWGTTHALRRAIVKLQHEAGESREKPVWQEKRFVGRRLQGSWMRFLQNAEQLDRRALPCNVEDYINDDTVVHGPGNAPLAELIPNLLTSLGILGTFLGMMRGLTGLDMSTADSLMSGIPILLNGMRFAFGTSVAGISCSLVLNMLVHIAQGSGYHAIDEFTESFTQLAMQRPLDNDVQMICQNQDRNNMLFNATDGLAVQMGMTVERAVGNAMHPVAQSLDRFMAVSTRAQVEGIGRVVNAFVDHMNESLQGQFLQLGETLTALNANQSEAVRHTEEALRSSGEILQEAERLRAVSTEVMASFEKYMKSLTDARSRDEHFEQSAVSALERMQEMARQQTAVLEQMKDRQSAMTAQTDEFRKTMLAAAETGRRSTAETTEQMKQSAETIRKAGDELSGSYQHFVTDVVEGFSRSLGLFERSMNDLVVSLNEQIDRVPASGEDPTAAAQLSEIQRLLKTIAQGVETKSHEQTEPEKEA